MTERIAKSAAHPHALYKEHGYSPAILSGDMLFVSGMVGARQDGSPEPDFRKQVELAFENLKATLAGAGCTFDDVVDVMTFHTDPERQFETVWDVKAKYLNQTPPHTITALGVNWLAGFDFEIKVIARVPAS